MHSDERLAGGAAVVAVAVGLLAGLIDQMWRFPSTTAPSSELVEFVSAQRTALLIAMILNSVAVTLWLMFGAGVWTRMRRTADGVFAASFVLGLVGFVTLLLGGFLFFFVLVYRAPDVVDPRLHYDIAFGLLAMSGLPTALALGAYATHVHRVGAFPQWTAYLAWVAAIIHLVLLATLVDRAGFLSLEGPMIILAPATLFLWIAGTGWAMVVDGS